MPIPVELIVVACGEASKDLSLLLESLRPQIRSDGEVAVRVATNTCTESTTTLLAGLPWVQSVEFDSNFGYGGAVNRVFFAQPTHPAWIVACNSDLVFPDGSIEAMLAALRRVPDDVACVAPQLLDPPGCGGRVQPSVGEFPTLASLLSGRLRARRTRKYRPTPVADTDVDWATGACVAFRSSAFEAVGGFDDAIFLDYEETDLCKRLADHGWRRRFVPSWQVIHTSPNAQSPPNPARHIHTRQSLVRYLAKHRPPWEVRAFGLMLRSTLVVRGSSHPFAPSWRAGVDTCRQLHKRQRP